MGVTASLAAPVGAAVARLTRMGDCKMVLVVRTDLKMSQGKVAAQACHACLAAYRAAVASTDARQQDALAVWETFGEAKITLKTSSEAELLELHRRARDGGLNAEYVRDAGHTQVAAGSVTVLAIGPDESARINAVTGHLKLL